MNAIMPGSRTLQRFDIEDGFEDTMAAVDADGSAIVERFVGPDLLARLNQYPQHQARRARARSTSTSAKGHCYISCQWMMQH